MGPKSVEGVKMMLRIVSDERSHFVRGTSNTSCGYEQFLCLLELLRQAGAYVRGVCVFGL